MKYSDVIGDPCACPQCMQAGVSEVAVRRDPRSGAWLHGYDLTRWYQAREQFLTRARAAVGARGRHAAGFEPLAEKADRDGSF